MTDQTIEPKAGQESTPPIAINGMAHVILTVSNWEAARAFYKALMPDFGMSCVFDGPEFCYHVGARTAVGIRKCDPAFADERFVQYRVGLHHLCLRARTREDIDRTAVRAAELGARIIRGPVEDDWAPGYYYVLFEDPDGIRLEVNHIPGQGVFGKDNQVIGSGGDYEIAKDDDYDMRG